MAVIPAAPFRESRYGIRGTNGRRGVLEIEALREQGRYEKMRKTIIDRDIALAGSPNPMLVRHGEASPAAQYSGRVVDEDWVCPFSDTRAA